MSRPRFAYLLLLVAPVFFASNMLVARWAAGAIAPGLFLATRSR